MDTISFNESDKQDMFFSAESEFKTDFIKNELKKSIVRHLQCSLAREKRSATMHDWLVAVALVLRERIFERFIKTQKQHHSNNVRRIYYMSLEYLPGRMLRIAAQALGLFEDLEAALNELGKDFESIEEAESDMGLGNGGLGRLASCFQDSLATLDYPAVAYGIHYEFGLFKQKIVDGKQVETPDNWLKFGNPWQICRPENVQTVQLFGRIDNNYDDHGRWCPKWVDGKIVQGVPWDIPVVGYDTTTVNFMRL